MKEKFTETVHIYDFSDDDSAVFILRAFENHLSLTISKEYGGDIEALLSKDDALKVTQSIDQSISKLEWTQKSSEDLNL